MKKFFIAFTVIVGAIVVTLIVLFTLNNQTVEAPEANVDLSQSPDTQPPEETEPQLSITDMLLPPNSYEARGDNPYTHVMLHFASDAKANPENPHNVNAVYNEFKKAEIGAHYYIDRGGAIYRFIAEENTAYHAGSQAGSLPGFPADDHSGNDHAIGIELAGIGTQGEMEKYGIDAATYSRIPEKDIGYTNDQYQSLQELLDDIVERHNITYDRSHIVGHDEYVPEMRTDPGQLFDWARIGLTAR